MKCPSCQFENPEAMKFCVECGVRLLVRCTQCNTEMLPKYKFCGECGASLKAAGSPAPLPRPTAGPRAVPEPASVAAAAATPQPPAEGERKQVSVLVCSLVPSEAMETPLSTDEQHTLLSRFFERAQPEIERFGGTISRYSNQGFMALFGAPVAWEDHPHRAVLAALALVERAVLDEQHAVRVGIDTGPVVVGGVGASVGAMALGEATERATAIEQQARAGEILISAQTAQRVRGQAVLKDHRSIEVSEDLIKVFAVRPGKAEQLPSNRAGGLGLSPFVGREHELAALERLRDLAAQGQGQVVGLVGEAGAGKSRLLHEFLQRTQSQDDISYLRGQCLSYGSGVPNLPLVDMIRRASRIAERDDADMMAAKLRDSLEQVGTDLDSLPYFLRLLGVEQGNEALTGLEPQAIQARTFAAMRRMLLDAAQHSLVVLEIEDLHWIDDTTAEFLGSLVEIMAAARLLVIATYRSGVQPEWLEKSFATQITLRQLTEDDSRQLVAGLLERSEQELELDEALLGKAEGNPLFLEELTRSLMEAESHGEGVPDTVQGILMARIDGLPQKHRRLLRTASVLGRRMNRKLLDVLWGEESMDPLLEDLQRWELIYKAPSEDRESYVFKHALTQEVAYESLLANRRQELHARAAHALEERHVGHLEEVYHELVYHYPLAGEPGKTVHYLTLFAEQAARNFAHAEAAKALREALPHVEQLPVEERDRRLFEVLLQLAESLLPLAAFPETLELFERYLPRMEEVEDEALASRYYFWLAHTHTYLGNQEATREYAEKAIKTAQKAGDETTEGKACYVLGRDGFWSGRFADGIKNSLRAVVLLERTGEVWWQGQAYWVAGFNHYVLGQFKEAIEAVERCCAIGEALDDHRLDASWSLGYFYASLGEAEKGIEYCRRGVEGARDPLNSAVAMGFLGYAMVVEGKELEGAVEKLKAAVERMREAGMQQLEGWFGVFLGEALLAQGDRKRVEVVAEAALDSSKQAGFQYGMGLARHALGRVALSGEEYEKADRDLRRALEIFEKLGVAFEHSKIHLDVARLCLATGAVKEARTEVGWAQRGFEELGVKPRIKDAQKLSSEIDNHLG